MYRREAVRGVHGMTRDQRLPQSFATYPQSLSAARAEKSDAASDWTAKDVLIELLRQIDKGAIHPEAMIVVFRDVKETGERETGLSNCGNDGYVTLGMLHVAMNWITKDWQ
jgi:hypothetical protein